MEEKDEIVVNEGNAEHQHDHDDEGTYDEGKNVSDWVGVLR